MRFLLRLKHWQLFLFTWGVAILISVLSFAAENLIIELFPVMMLVLTIGFLGWIWAISVELHELVPPDVPLPLRQFKIYFAIPILYSLMITVWMAYTTSTGNAHPDFTMHFVIGLILILHLVSMVCIVMGIRFAAKTLKSIELGRHARFNEYVGEFFLIWFSIIGIWILQPVLNSLTEKQKSV
jgi:hypothetical protein